MQVLVVDDEAPARQRLRDLLRRDPDVGVVQEATDGRDAVALIRRTVPDLVLLDVQMPELDGLGVVDAVGVEAMPLTVFVTAHDQHAIRAFETNAIDYLLKPFGDERFEAMLSRVRARLADRTARVFHDRLARLLAPAADTSSWIDRIVVKMGGATRLLAARDIDWIEAAGVYVTLHAGNRAILHRMALSDLEARLDPRVFIRIHRSSLVNLEKVSHLEPLSHGEFEVVMRSGARVRLSRTYRAHLESRLGQSL